MAAPDTISRPGLGEEINLGMLYNARTGEMFSGVSLWDAKQMGKVTDLPPAQQAHRVQWGDFTYSKSSAKSRAEVGLDVEGSLSIDCGLVEAKGSASYLKDTRKSAHEARVDVSCRIARRTRSIPMETLSAIKYGDMLNDARFTHFVAEVTEGASGTLSFVRRCGSEEEEMKLSGQMEARLKILPMPLAVSMKVELKEEEKKEFDDVEISYSGALAENVSTLEDAVKVAHEMPEKLMKQMNTLSYKLLPISLLDSKAYRIVRSMDAVLVDEASSGLRAGKTTSLRLEALRPRFAKFPAIQQQVVHFAKEYGRCRSTFTQVVRESLPKIKGSLECGEPESVLRKIVATFDRQTTVAKEFAELKEKECDILFNTVQALEKAGFDASRLGDRDSTAVLSSVVTDASDGAGDGVALLLTLGAAIKQHPLAGGLSADDEKSDSDDEVFEEWFQDAARLAHLRGSVQSLLGLKSRCLEHKINTHFVIVACNKLVKKGKRCKLSPGDILLDIGGTLTLVKTEELPFVPPKELELMVKGTDQIDVSWSAKSKMIPATSYDISYQARPNPQKDGPFGAPTGEEKCEVQKARGLSVCLRSLKDDTDYEVRVRAWTAVGPSEWSAEWVERTQKEESCALAMAEFFKQNRRQLEQAAPEVNPRACALGYMGNAKPYCMPWSLQGDHTLYLGHRVITERATRSGRLGLRIVEVASGFKPEVHAAPIKECFTIAFLGATGVGKSTQINAFIAQLLRQGLGDEWRIMTLDDRKMVAKEGYEAGDSITKWVTCYVVRPLTALFQGKTLLIVDTPGFLDTDGPKEDQHTRKAIGVMFETIHHVNAIVLTAKHNETKTNMLQPSVDYVFSLFGKDMSTTLRTIYTFSDVGTPEAQGILKRLGWPTDEDKCFEVNNSAFGLRSSEERGRVMARDMWTLCMKTQYRVFDMLLKMDPVPTELSAKVTRNRIQLEESSAVVKKKMIASGHTAVEMLANMEALARAVGAPPEKKIAVPTISFKEVDVEPGKYTTLCMVCNRTCHEVCSRRDDADKQYCAAMQDGFCTVCPKKCSWKEHRNAQFIVKAEKGEKWVTCGELLKKWAEDQVGTPEAALLRVIDQYLEAQREIREDIMALHELSTALEEEALLHDPESLSKYIQTLIDTAEGASVGAGRSPIITELMVAKNTLVLAAKVKREGTRCGNTQGLSLVMERVRDEMKRRMAMTERVRAEEEKKACKLYNDWREAVLKDRPDLEREVPSSFGRTPVRWSDNLKQAVKLVKVLLKNGGVTEEES